MKLSISNIGWQESDDRQVINLINKYGYTGLEIAPTRVFPNMPYDCLPEAKEWARKLKEDYGLIVPSMQSIWYGRQEKIFGADIEREELLEYTKKAILFAEGIGCKNLVFGCPRNRYIPEGADEGIGVKFFRQLSEYAHAHGTVL